MNSLLMVNLGLGDSSVYVNDELYTNGVDRQGSYTDTSDLIAKISEAMSDSQYWMHSYIPIPEGTDTATVNAIKSVFPNAEVKPVGISDITYQGVLFVDRVTSQGAWNYGASRTASASQMGTIITTSYYYDGPRGKTSGFCVLPSSALDTENHVIRAGSTAKYIDVVINPANQTYSVFVSISTIARGNSADIPYSGLDWTKVIVTTPNSATYTVSTDDTIDTITVTVADGYVFNSAALYDPTDRLVQRWKELPEGGVIRVRRDQPGEWTLRITCNEILSPYNPTVPIEDLPTDTITPTYPTDYIGKYIGAGFYKLFIPTVAQLNAFVNYLYTQTFMDAIMQLWNKMLGIEEMIVGVNIIPGAPTVAGTAIPKVGWVSMTESQAMNYTTQQYLEINLGSLDVTRAWGNYLDFAPYTKISIYLPFIGERTLDTNDVMAKTLNVRYHIDLLSGNCVAYVFVNGSIHYQFSGNCAYSIPISSADTANLFLQPLKAIAGMTLAGVGVATGNPMAIAAGHALGATVGSDESGAFVSPPSAEISAPDVRKVDGLNANTGYMGTIRPYLSIERVKPDINSGFGQEIGYQSNKFRTLGNLAGFTKVSEVHLEGITATTAELTQIEAMLKEGVII